MEPNISVEQNPNRRRIYRAIVPYLAVGVLTFAVFNTGGRPLFSDISKFVIFAKDGIEIEKLVQVSSGDVGSNKELDINKDAIINGNLFADQIDIDKNSLINGNASFNKLKLEKDTKILGTKTDHVSLPVANLPEIPSFQVGTQDLNFQGQNNTLAAGNYRNLTLEKDSRLTLAGGTYNLSKLVLKENSVLIFSAPVQLNIRSRLFGQMHVSILPGANVKPDDLAINYAGERIKGEKNENEDETESKEDAHPAKFGPSSLLNFKLLAPKASVKIGDATTFRGQILARKVKIEKDSVLSREIFFEKEGDPAKIVSDQGLRFFVNEVVILFKEEATQSDIQMVADLLNGKVTAFIPLPKIVKIEVQTTTAQELNNKIQLIKNSNNPLIIEVGQNLIGAR